MNDDEFFEEAHEELCEYSDRQIVINCMEILSREQMTTLLFSLKRDW